jgi:ABC-type multidrug transport system fused ATPase/permease subunit
MNGNHERLHDTVTADRPGQKGLFAGWSMILHALAGRDKLQFSVILLTALAINGFVSLMNPLAIKLILDEGVIKKRFSSFILLSFGFLLVFTCWRAALFWYRLYLQSFKNKVLRAITMDMLRRFYGLPYSKVLQRESGYFVSRIYDEASAAVLPAIDCTTVLVNSSIAALTSIVLALLFSWRGTFVLLIVVPASYVLASHFGAKLKRSTKHEKEAEARFRGVLAQSISAYKIARVFDLRDKVIEEACGSFDRFLEAFNRRFKDSAIYTSLAGLSTSWIESIVMIVGGFEILSGRMSFGAFLAFLNAFWAATGGIRQLLEQTGELPRISASFERIKEFEADRHPSLALRGSTVLELKGAAFSYEEGAAAVFGDLSLRVDMGEKVLVTGPNGTGKSTLANVLAGFLEVSTGHSQRAPLDRISLATFPMNFVPGTVRANFSFGNGVARRNILDQLLEHLGIADLLDRYPAELSAGQQQRVYLAMALLKDADFYIFDEPLAHIDTDTRPLILNSILKYTEKKGLISIMHGDVSFHSRFDRIVSMAMNPG